MKKIKLVVLLSVFTPFLFAQAPLSDQKVNTYDNSEIKKPNRNSLLTFDLIENRQAILSAASHSNSSNIEKYLLLEGMQTAPPILPEEVVVTGISAEDIDKQGTIGLDLSGVTAFNFLKNKYDGDDDGNTGSRTLYWRGGINFLDGWALRGDLQLNGSTYEPEEGDGEQKFRGNFCGADLVKNITVADRVVNVFGRYGYGKNKWEDVFSGMSNDFEEKITSYGGGIEVPVALPNTAAYFTPRIQYLITEWEWDNAGYGQTLTTTDNYSALSLSAGMYSFFNCAMFDPCDKDGLGLSSGNYDQGSICLGGNTGLNLEFGNEEIETENNPTKIETKNTHTGLNIDAGYFVADGIAGRVLINYGGEKVKNDDTDVTLTNTDLWLGAGLVFHPPLEGELNNLYGHVEFQAGTDKQKFENGSSSETKDKITHFGGGIGYNLFFIKGVALSPEINYNVFTNDQDNGPELKASGLNLNFGLKSFF